MPDERGRCMSGLEARSAWMEAWSVVPKPRREVIQLSDYPVRSNSDGCARDSLVSFVLSSYSSIWLSMRRYSSRVRKEREIKKACMQGQLECAFTSYSFTPVCCRVDSKIHMSFVSLYTHHGCTRCSSSAGKTSKHDIVVQLKLKRLHCDVHYRFERRVKCMNVPKARRTKRLPTIGIEPMIFSCQ